MKKIVVIEDDQTLAESIRQGLTSHDFQVECFTDPPAIDTLTQSPPSLLIVDCILGTTSGPDYLNKVRTIPELRFVPTILITGYEELLGPMEELTGNHCSILKKPFTLSQLKSETSRALSTSH